MTGEPTVAPEVGQIWRQTTFPGGKFIVRRVARRTVIGESWMEGTVADRGRPARLKLTTLAHGWELDPECTYPGPQIKRNFLGRPSRRLRG